MINDLIKINLTITRDCDEAILFNNLIKLNIDDLAALAIKQNEAELQKLRDEVNKLTEEIRRIQGE